MMSEKSRSARKNNSIQNYHSWGKYTHVPDPASDDTRSGWVNPQKPSTKTPLAIIAYCHQYTFLNNLAAEVLTRFEQQVHCKDIDEAIALHREALALQGQSHADCSMSLDNLVASVLTRFKKQRDFTANNSTEGADGNFSIWGCFQRITGISMSSSLIWMRPVFLDS
jgi:hypothetical protein